MSARSRGSRFDSLRITPGAGVIIGLEIALSLVWLLSGIEAKAGMGEWLLATPDTTYRSLRLWTLVSSIFLETQFLSLILHGVVMWSFVPTLERFWGTKRFYRFFFITSIVATAVGAAVGLLTGRNLPIAGLDAFILAAIVAFGIVYAKQPVQFFGVLPLTGRQLMWGFIAVHVLLVLLNQMWETGAAYAGAMGAAALLTSKRWSPGLAFNRWRIRRARAKLSVLEGGAPTSTRPRDPQKWLN